MIWIDHISTTALTPINTCAFTCTSQACFPCDGQTAESIRQANTINLSPTIISATSTVAQIAADGMMIWRCFMTWNRDYRIIILPMLCLVGFAASTIWTEYNLVQIYLIRLHAPPSETAPPANWIQYNIWVNELNNAADVLPLSVNAITLLAIAGRILFITHGLTSLQPGVKRTTTYNHIVYMLVESQALLLFAYILQLIGSHTQGMLSGVSQAILEQTFGISPSLLIIQLALGPKSEVVTGITEEPTTLESRLASSEPSAHDATRTTPDTSKTIMTSHATKKSQGGFSEERVW